MHTTTISRPSTGSRVRAAIGVADGLAVGALVLSAVASVAGLLVGGLYRDPAEGVRQAQATDLVTLVAAVPLLAMGLWQAHRGSRLGRVVALGALGYLAYSYAIYGFSVVINPMTPVHVAILGLATWALVLMVFGRSDARQLTGPRFRVARRTPAAFLAGVAGLFALLWLSQIGAAISSGTLPVAVRDLHLPTSPVYTLDLAFALPVLVVAAAWLLRRDPRGPATALAALTFIVLMGLSVLSIFAVDAAAGIAPEAAPIAIFGIVTGIAGAFVGRAALTERGRRASV